MVEKPVCKLGLYLKAPLNLTWSCYENGDNHCGRCGPCSMRRTGFLINRVKDTIPYEYTPEDFWSDIE